MGVAITVPFLGCPSSVRAVLLMLLFIYEYLLLIFECETVNELLFSYLPTPPPPKK